MTITLQRLPVPLGWPFWCGLATLVLGLAVLQDYLFSQLKDTGFYLAESLLYNVIWLLALPLLYCQSALLRRRPATGKLSGIGLSLMLAVSLALVHVLLFAGFFVTLSTVLFAPAHRFSAIFRTAMSNQFSLLVFLYALAPIVARVIGSPGQGKQQPPTYPARIRVKVGPEWFLLDTAAIETIVTHKPYTLITAAGKTYLHDDTLKGFASLLDPEVFVRVHRATIVNKAFLKSLRSRRNGDYDATLSNGQTIRLSRHYRANWQELLQ